MKDCFKAAGWLFLFFISDENLAASKCLSCLLLFSFYFFEFIYSSLLQILILLDVLNFMVNLY